MHIDLTPEGEAQLIAIAKHKGLSVAEVVLLEVS
jgi:hypothetical protein